MQNFTFFIFFQLIFICISQRDLQQHLDIQCQSKLFENIFTNIRIEYVKNIIPDNIEEVQIKSILEHLLCEKLNNQQALSENKIYGALPIWQILNIKNNLNFEVNSECNKQENNNKTCCIDYYLTSDEEDVDFIFYLSFNDQDDCNGDLNLSAIIKFEIKYSVIRHIIVCALIVILQIIQIDKNQRILKGILQDEYGERLQIKILSLPLLMQIILDNTFMVTILKEVGAISSDNESFLIYVFPILFQAYIMLWINWMSFMMIFQANNQVEHCCCDNSLIVHLFSLIIGALNIASIILFSIVYENHTIYQMCIPFIYLPQILYNFKFKKIQFDHKNFFANLSTKVFYVLYVRGFPLKQRDVVQDLQVVYIVGSAFFIQLLILYLQHQYGPKKLICQKSKKDILLQNQIVDSECPICKSNLLDEESNLNFSIQKKNVILTDCHHIFHTECLQKWVEVNVTCPICRKFLNETIFE